MGLGITYCDGCGQQVLEPDLRAGKAVALASHSFCPECVAKSSVKPAPAKPAARPSRPPSLAAPANASPAKPLAIAACLLAVGILGAVLLAQKSNREPAPRAATPKPPPASTAAALPAAAPAKAPDSVPTPAPATPRFISPDKAGDYVGKTITVEFTVVSVGSSARSDTVFLNCTSRAGKGDFAAVIFKSSRAAFEKAFGEDLEAAFKGRKVRVTGEVKSFKDSPEIILEEPGKVQIVR